MAGSFLDCKCLSLPIGHVWGAVLTKQVCTNCSCLLAQTQRVGFCSPGIFRHTQSLSAIPHHATLDNKISLYLNSRLPTEQEHASW